MIFNQPELIFRLEYMLRNGEELEDITPFLKQTLEFNPIHEIHAKLLPLENGETPFLGNEHFQSMYENFLFMIFLSNMGNLNPFIKGVPEKEFEKAKDKSDYKYTFINLMFNETKKLEQVWETEKNLNQYLKTIQEQDDEIGTKSRLPEKKEVIFNWLTEKVCQIMDAQGGFFSFNSNPESQDGGVYVLGKYNTQVRFNIGNSFHTFKAINGNIEDQTSGPWDIYIEKKADDHVSREREGKKFQDWRIFRIFIPNEQNSKQKNMMYPSSHCVASFTFLFNKTEDKEIDSRRFKENFRILLVIKNTLQRFLKSIRDKAFFTNWIISETEKEKIKEAQEEKNKLGRMISHGLGPLLSISNDILSNLELTNDKSKIQFLKDQNASVQTVIRFLLSDITKIKGEFKAFSLEDLLKDVEASFNYHIKNKKDYILESKGWDCTLEIFAPKNFKPIIGDRFLLWKALDNLIVNAIEAAERQFDEDNQFQGHVFIECSSESNNVIFKVVSNTAIKEKIKDNIQNMFLTEESIQKYIHENLTDQQKRAGHNEGLGLKLVTWIIRDIHEGKLKIVTRDKTQFIIEIIHNRRKP